ISETTLTGTPCSSRSVAAEWRRSCGRIGARQVHVDTSSFAVSGAYAAEVPDETVADGVDAAVGAAEGDLETRVVAHHHGYSPRDRRSDLKQWMLALATTREGDIPLFLRSLDGNSSDHISLVATI